MKYAAVVNFVSAKPAVPFVVLAVGIWVAGVSMARLTRGTHVEQRPPWQHSFLELDEPGQRLYRTLREGIYEAENRRGETQHWPSPEALAAEGIAPFATWSLKQQGPYLNYLGEGAGLRWLVLFIEPDPREAPSTPPPADEEHHTLTTGLALHVTVWTQPLTEPRPAGVLSFPVSEGWVQRVGQ